MFIQISVECLRDGISGLTVDSPIKSMTSLYEGFTVIRSGILERNPEPEFEAFVAQRDEWLPAVLGTKWFLGELNGEKVE